MRAVIRVVKGGGRREEAGLPDGKPPSRVERLSGLGSWPETRI